MDSHMTFRVYPNCSYRTHLPGVYCMLGFWSPCTSKFWSQIASSMEVYILNAISGGEVQGAEKKTEKRADVGGFWKILPSEGVCTWKFLSKSYYMRKFCCSEAVTKEVSAWNWAFVSETKTIQWLLTFYVRLFLAPGKKILSIFLVQYHSAFASRKNRDLYASLSPPVSRLSLLIFLSSSSQFCPTVQPRPLQTVLPALVSMWWDHRCGTMQGITFGVR